MKLSDRLLSIACLGLSQLLPLALVKPAFADVTPPSEAAQRLMQMFSPQIQATINACAENGMANLAAGANPDGSLACVDGSTAATVAYADYLDTVSNVLAASLLVGVKTAMATDARITPEMLVAYLASSQGDTMLRQGIQTAITQNRLLPANAPQSVSLLTDAVMTRLAPSLQTPDTFSTLLGTTEQYSQVVSNFCTPPGMPVAQAQSAVPGLNPIQLYAICIQESGVASEILRMAR